ncbi:hypothetical protein GCM10027093_41640 [Paraburkholderia jirisanensis]
MLMVSMEPPASLEEEFNDWYDTEHFPQRCALPGFRSGSRWVCLDGWPRWMALYDLETIHALQSDAYRAVSGAHATPWSRRILPRTVGRTRVVALAVDAEQAREQHAASETCRLLVIGTEPTHDLTRARGIAAALRESLARREDLLQLRSFVESSGALWTCAAFAAPVSAAELAASIGRPGGASIANFNLYAPYQRSGY